MLSSSEQLILEVIRYLESFIGNAHKPYIEKLKKVLEKGG
jgi:hypothetical protein